MRAIHTPEELHDFVYEHYMDFVFLLPGTDREVVLYADSGHTQVVSDRVYSFPTWEDMLKAPVFYGKTLAEVLPILSEDVP